MDELQRMIINWAKYDKQIKELNLELSSLRKKRDRIQNNLIPMIKENNLDENIFSIESLKTNISLKENKISESMSYKFLQDKFIKFFDDTQKAEELLQYIKHNRKKETNLVLKSSDIFDIEI